VSSSKYAVQKASALFFYKQFGSRNFMEVSFEQVFFSVVLLGIGYYYASKVRRGNGTTNEISHSASKRRKKPKRKSSSKAKAEDDVNAIKVLKDNDEKKNEDLSDSENLNNAEEPGNEDEFGHEDGVPPTKPQILRLIPSNNNDNHTAPRRITRNQEEETKKQRQNRKRREKQKEMEEQLKQTFKTKVAPPSAKPSNPMLIKPKMKPYSQNFNTKDESFWGDF
jgi:hypothetical protein